MELILHSNYFQFDKDYIHTLGTAMRNKMVPTWVPLTLLSLEENLYKIKGENATTVSKQNFLYQEKDTKMAASYIGNTYVATLTIYMASSETYTQNKIHHGTRL